ncbi:MAG: 2'-5' RNA ligase family protein [Bacteroidales bacterium]
MEFHRTFLALPLEVPESFRAARTSLRESLAGEKIRWVEPGLMHLTLRFLGDVRNEDLEKIGAGIRGGLDRPGNLVCSLAIWAPWRKDSSARDCRSCSATSGAVEPEGWSG